MPTSVSKLRWWPRVLLDVWLAVFFMFFGYKLSPQSLTPPWLWVAVVGFLIAAGVSAGVGLDHYRRRAGEPPTIAPSPLLSPSNGYPARDVEQTKEFLVPQIAPIPSVPRPRAAAVGRAPATVYPRPVPKPKKHKRSTDVPPLGELIGHDLFQAKLDSEVRGYQMGRFDRDDDTGDVESPKKEE